MMMKDAEGEVATRLDAHLAKRPFLHDVTLPTFVDAELVTKDLPNWWLGNGNTLWKHPSVPAFSIKTVDTDVPPRGAVIIVGRDARPPPVLLWGEKPIVLLAEDSNLGDGQIICGSGSTVVVGPRVACVSRSEINCRNGGLIFVGADGLWSDQVRLYSDDMHAIRDQADGRRLNPFGDCVIVGRHVWLGIDAMLLPGARVGPDSVIGARTVVSGEPMVPANSVCVGSPARVVRSGITWSRDDVP